MSRLALSRNEARDFTTEVWKLINCDGKSEYHIVHFLQFHIDTIILTQNLAVLLSNGLSLHWTNACRYP